MNNRLTVQDRIAGLLAVFSRKLSILSANNEYSWNSLAENVFIPLLNHALEGSFVNENIETFSNTPSIDLVDRSKRVTIQVTSTGNFSKVKKTIEKFFNHSLENDFDTLYFFILTEKKGFSISADHEEQLCDIIQDRIKFNHRTHVLDFGKIYTLFNKVPIDNLVELNSELEKELGILSSQLIKISPAVTILFEESIVESAFIIVKGLLERDLRIRYFCKKLEKLIEKSSIQSEYCQRLYDVSNESSATLILSTKKYVEGVDQGSISDTEMSMLKNPHLKHVLIKFDDDSSFRKFDWISPMVRRGVLNDLNPVINYASNELHKVNKVIEIQDYSDFETIIKLYDNKAHFGKTITHKDSKKKTGFKLLPATDKLRGVTTNYLFIPKGSNIAPTVNVFYKDNPTLRGRKDSIILFIPKERNQIRLENRLKNAEKAFKPKKAFYLDEFISEHCAKGFIEQDSDMKFSSTKNFIQPELKAIEGELSDFDQIENWILSEFDPMLIITGGGGIGKTTLAREIADMYYQINTNAKIVFIEASNPKVIQNLTRLSETGRIDLYDFYSSIDNLSKVSRDLFRVTIDNGNLMLIIDGLDEVFSRIPDFDVDYFINSVSTDFVQQIGVGKVLLTCRTYFWKEQISKENSVNHFEIEPFSQEHAQRFYEKKFNDVKKVRKAIRLLKEMDTGQKGGGRYLPFVVDIIGEVINSDGEIIQPEEDIDLKYLDIKNQIDFIVYRLLNRERIKIGVDVNSQIQFLIDLGVFHHGTINKNEIEVMKGSSSGLMLDNKRVESLKSHPFISVTNDNIEFKYDFFELYFKALYLSDFISLESNESISQQVIDILLQEGKFGSSLFHEIAKRNETTWSEDNILKIADLMEALGEFNLNESNNIHKTKHQIKSSLFALALTINQNHYNNQKATNTHLLKLMLGTNKIIKGLSLVNFGILEGNIKFNFNDLRFEECYFDSYDSFWECNFNESTKFINCTFYNMSDYSRSSSRGISRDIFIDPRHDTSFDEYFDAQDQSSASKRKGINHALSKYFRLFYNNGMIYDKDNKSSIRAKYHPKYQKNLPVNIIENVLKTNGEIKIEFDRVRGEDVASINFNFREDVLKLLLEGVETNKMKKIIDSMAVK